MISVGADMFALRNPVDQEDSLEFCVQELKLDFCDHHKISIKIWL